MDYSKWALSRVDELERRVAVQESESKAKMLDSLEFAIENENEYVSAMQSRQIDFPEFFAAKGQSITIIATLCAKYDFDSSFLFSLVINGEKVGERRLFANAHHDVSFVCVKTIKCFDDGRVNAGILIESDDQINLTIVSRGLNVIGPVLQTNDVDLYGKTSADFYDKNAQDFVIDLPNGYELFDVGAKSSFGASARIVVGDATPNESIDSEQNNSAQLSPNGIVLKEGQKFAVGYVLGGDVYLFKRDAGEIVDNITGQKIGRGTAVAVAFNKFGDLFVARKLQNGNLFVHFANNPAAELFVCSCPQDFDIVRAPSGSEYSLAVVFTKDGSLFVRYLSNEFILSDAFEIDSLSSSCVSAVRGCTNRMYFIVSGRRNEIIECTPSPAANQNGCYGAAVSVLVY